MVPRSILYYIHTSERHTFYVFQTIWLSEIIACIITASTYSEIHRLPSCKTIIDSQLIFISKLISKYFLWKGESWDVFWPPHELLYINKHLLCCFNHWRYLHFARLSHRPFSVLALLWGLQKGVITGIIIIVVGVVARVLVYHCTRKHCPQNSKHKSPTTTSRWIQSIMSCLPPVGRK